MLYTCKHLGKLVIKRIMEEVTAQECTLFLFSETSHIGYIVLILKKSNQNKTKQRTFFFFFLHYWHCVTALQELEAGRRKLSPNLKYSARLKLGETAMAIEV